MNRIIGHTNNELVTEDDCMIGLIRANHITRKVEEVEGDGYKRVLRKGAKGYVEFPKAIAGWGCVVGACKFSLGGAPGQVIKLPPRWIQTGEVVAVNVP